jgi:hypothetical protein
MPVEVDTLDSGRRVSVTGMGYSDCLMEECIRDNGEKIKEKVIHIKGLQMGKNIMGSIRIEREFMRSKLKYYHHFVK